MSTRLSHSNHLFRAAVRSFRSAFCGRMITQLVAVLTLAHIVTGCLKRNASEDAQAQDAAQLAQQAAHLLDSIKCLVPAPGWYKQMWLDINAESNQLGRAFMNHYMGCSGSKYTLSEQEVRSLPLSMVEDPFNSMLLFAAETEQLRKEKTLKEEVYDSEYEETILASTYYGNTLGHFQMRLKGRLLRKKNEFSWILPRFEGQIQILDRYDFNPSESGRKDSWRGSDTELRVRLAHVGLPGKAFDVESKWIPFSFDIPPRAGDLIQSSVNDDKSGYSAYGEQVQLILMSELRSERWAKASAQERLAILSRTMKRLHDAGKMR